MRLQLVFRELKNKCNIHISSKFDYYQEYRLKKIINAKIVSRERQLVSEKELVFRSYLKKKKEERLKFVFIVQEPEMWASLKSVYDASLKSAMVDSYILCVPKKKRGTDSVYSTKEIFDDTNQSYQYFADLGYGDNVIKAYNVQHAKWFDLESLKPDCVFYMRPYDDYYPQLYKSETVYKYARVCYVPYAYCTFWNTEKSIYNISFINNAFAVFTENSFYQNMVKKTYEDVFESSNKAIEFLGFPRFDLYHDLKRSNETYQSKNVLWLPRWATNKYAERTTFFKYKDVITNFFINSKDRLICRPHPLMFREFVAKGVMTQDEVDAFLSMFKNNDNFEYDNYPDYIESLLKADVFLADFSSLIMEELITLKPIIFLGNPSKLYGETEKIVKYLYVVKNNEQLIECLSQILNGNDPKRKMREREIPQLFLYDGRAGERIVEYMSRECYLE